MNLYTILMEFEDRTVGISQYESESPEWALFKFIEKSESLEEYKRQKLLSIATNRSKDKSLLIHIADQMEGFWIMNFGIELQEIPEFSSIYGGYIVQTDKNGPIRVNQ